MCSSPYGQRLLKTISYQLVVCNPRAYSYLSLTNSDSAQLKVQGAHLLCILVMNVLYQQEERYQTCHGRGVEGGQYLRLSQRRHQSVGSPAMATFTELLRDTHASALPPLEATGWACFLAC